MGKVITFPVERRLEAENVFAAFPDAEDDEPHYMVEDENGVHIVPDSKLEAFVEDRYGEIPDALLPVLRAIVKNWMERVLEEDGPQ